MYADVDNAEAAFEEFQHLDLETLGNVGRLVVVSGDTGCGKTSLIHRCINHLIQQLPEKGYAPAHLPVMMANLAQTPRLDRVRAVREHIYAHVGQFLLEGTEVSEKVNAATAFATIGRGLLAGDLVLLVTVPPFADALNLVGRGTDLQETVAATAELDDYLAYAATPRVIFFAESSNPSGITRWFRNLERERQECVMTLGVGPVQPGNGSTFVDNRMMKFVGEADDPILPGVLADEVIESFAKQLSVKALQDLLSGIWQYAVAQAPGTEIEPRHVESYYADLFKKGRFFDPGSGLGS